MLVNMIGLLSKAKEEGYTIGAFNIYNGEFIQAVAETAQEEHSPVIIQSTWDVLETFGVDYIAGVVQAVIKDKSVPISLHLDHGQNLTQILKCIKAGFSSVMYDGSHLSFEENISTTKEICRLAHSLNVSVEAQVGNIASSKERKVKKDGSSGFTDPNEAKVFVNETNVDAISISVGSEHGKLDGKTQLSLDLIKAISELTNIPLVLHGGTGISDKDVVEAIKLGVVKINIGTIVKDTFRTEMRGLLNNDPEIDITNLLLLSKIAMKKVVKGKLLLFGSPGKA